MDDLVSILCLSYKHKKYIEFAIQSFWNQEYKKIEILALDDGSDDDSILELNRLKKLSPFPMKVFFQENTGNIGLNFNKLFSKCSGKYVMFISLDDAILPNAISKKVALMKTNPKIQFVINSLIYAIDDRNKYINNFPQPLLSTICDPTVNDLLNLDFEELNAYYVQGCLFRREIIEAVGGFDNDMLGDDIILRTKLANYLKKNKELDFVTLHEQACLYRIHSSNISKNGLRQLKIVAQYLDRYFPGKTIPNKFIQWIAYVMRNMTYNDYIEFNKSINNFLNQETVIYRVICEIINSNLLDKKRLRKNIKIYRNLFFSTLIILLILIYFLLNNYS